MSASGSLVILLGGTGVIGSELARIAHDHGDTVLSISLDPDRTGDRYANHLIDLTRVGPGQLTGVLERERPAGVPVATIVDVMGLSPDLIDEVADFAKAQGAALAQISSSLLYRATAQGSYDETSPVVEDGPNLFPYQRLKLAQEWALMARKDVDWRIFRTNHVIGRGGLLGCIPDHNRDPDLLNRILRGEPLRLAQAGRVRLSFIHARDLASGLLSLCARASTARKVMNLVHPEPATAADYFALLAKHLGVASPVIETFDPEPESFWALTAQDNILTTTSPDIAGLTFDFDLESALADALPMDTDSYATLGEFLKKRIK